MEGGKEREKDRKVSLGDVLVCLGQWEMFTYPNNANNSELILKWTRSHSEQMNKWTYTNFNNACLIACAVRVTLIFLDGKIHWQSITDNCSQLDKLDNLAYFLRNTLYLSFFIYLFRVSIILTSQIAFLLSRPDSRFRYWCKNSYLRKTSLTSEGFFLPNNIYVCNILSIYLWAQNQCVSLLSIVSPMATIETDTQNMHHKYLWIRLIMTPFTCFPDFLL